MTLLLHRLNVRQAKKLSGLERGAIDFDGDFHNSNPP